MRITVPRDRKSAFEPQIVVKGQRRVGQVDEMILSLYARGMTTRDIHAHLAEIYGVEVSPALVSAVTDVVTTRSPNGRTGRWMPFTPFFTLTLWWLRSGTAARWRTRPPTWSLASMRTGSSTCWASGWAPPRDRGSGRACSRSSATAASGTSCSSAATGSAAFLTRSWRPGPGRQCKHASFTSSGHR